MYKNLKWKLLLSVVVIAYCIYSFWPPKDKIKLGLDLKGGMHLVLQVITEEALAVEAQQTADKIALEFKTKNIPFVSSRKSADQSIEVVGVDSAKDKEIGRASCRERVWR